jgi:hypothetical protein
LELSAESDGIPVADYRDERHVVPSAEASGRCSKDDEIAPNRRIERQERLSRENS